MAALSGGNKLEKALADIAKKMSGSLKVGFLEGATYPDGTSVAQVAFWNEYGTSNTEMRPFFRTMIAVESFGWGALISKAVPYYKYDGATVLQFMGVKISEELQQSIAGWRYPGNKPSTIAKKGFDKPLVETAHMQNSVDFEVMP
jgi:hypothetical protein